MDTPNISPRRRRRIFQEHALRQAGQTLEQIAAQTNVSIATVHADLRLLEEHWTLLTQDIHDDLLLQQVARLDQRLERLSRIDPIDQARRALGPDAQLSFDQLTQIEDRHERRLAHAERELRMLLKQLNIPHIYSGMRSPDHPEDEFADHETDRKNLKEPETISAPIPSKTLEIIASHPAEKNSPKSLKESLNGTLPRDTGRNKPCPCGSGQKRKHCHPQASSPRLDRGPARDLLTDIPDRPLPPGAEAEALHLTDEHQAAKARGDSLAEVNALEKIIALYNR